MFVYSITSNFLVTDLTSYHCFQLSLMPGSSFALWQHEQYGYNLTL